MRSSSVATMMPPRSHCLVTVRTYAEREKFLARRQQLEQQHAAQVSAGLALSAARERGLRVERDRQDSVEAEREVTRLVRRNGPRHPPPPLPDQVEDETDNAATFPTESEPELPSSLQIQAANLPNTSTTVTSVNSVPNTNNITTFQVRANNKLVLNSAVPIAKEPAVLGSKVQQQVQKLQSQSHRFQQPEQQQLLQQQQLKVTDERRSPCSPVGSPSHSPVQSRSPTPTAPPPHCPTPDYDSDSSCTVTPCATSSSTRVILHSGQYGEVEMQSMDSLELLEPRTKEPRPPKTYFQQNKASQRPTVCVTIREYGGAASRPPSRLQFLNNRSPPDSLQDHHHDHAAASRLQSELASTLSRSNLRNRTEGCITVTNGVKETDGVHRMCENGSIIASSVNGSTSSHLQIGNKAAPPNGILKKVAVNNCSSNRTVTSVVPNGLSQPANRSKQAGVPTKSISFGAKTTIITEKSPAT